MKLLSAFLKLVRWPNLVFIALTQVMFKYCVLQPIFQRAALTPNIQGVSFVLIILSYVFIAAAGYIINDYFDLNIDQVNKPDKVIIARVIRRRWALAWHIILSVLGILFSLYVDLRSGSKIAGFSAFCCVILLFFYSTTLKKKFLIGNIMVSAITAWPIIALTWFEGNQFFIYQSRAGNLQIDKIFRLTVLYTSFAFIISLIREVVKDMEDVEGDRRYGCKTMPIVWGYNAAKVFVAVWLVVLIALIVTTQAYVMRFGWWFSVIYAVVLIIGPLLTVGKKLTTAQSPSEYHKLSSLIKLVMLTGILSMSFFLIYS
ncbi:4-hydroxybenzoate polyprenyltransferase [Filimonas lacunae]|uniref:4-hydroxybenzoate polyprenyltransferase n=1 Tax=Filimonas lacunae TaxID=477680 RepID=A0A173MDZ8_9BACT|nr:geranylgeranylglycerol-phosphate geranylgeranyltransferase [Filimonas lacunae]BAV05747.1 similar to (S)-2,3-di-O-geranylgeranylglyceryl phosphate synthase [Filimonas lacunae]SIT28729.1 4-hydroxybenzoate polyprenyltransferase [Filimonas lacunae]